MDRSSATVPPYIRLKTNEMNHRFISYMGVLWSSWFGRHSLGNGSHRRLTTRPAALLPQCYSTCPGRALPRIVVLTLAPALRFKRSRTVFSRWSHTTESGGCGLQIHFYPSTEDTRSHLVSRLCCTDLSDRLRWRDTTRGVGRRTITINDARCEYANRVCLMSFWVALIARYLVRQVFMYTTTWQLRRRSARSSAIRVYKSPFLLD
jgi:hypothetical protein